MLFKSISIPAGSRELTAVRTWAVRWTSRRGEYSHDIRPEVETFTSEEEAWAFAASLRAAFKLIKHTNNDQVTVKEQ